MKRNDLVKKLNQLLDIYSYEDYCPNGLQIEGTEDINKIAFAVSATKATVEQAVEAKADMLIVHHGLFWKFHGVRTITKTFAARIKPLIKNDINLLGYHLPLDAHLELGNAKAVADLLEMTDIKAFGDYKGMPTGVQGKFKNKYKVSDLEKIISSVCHHQVMTSTNDPNQSISSMGIITGGANGDWYQAARLGLDAYLTGEMSEHDWHEAKEAGVTMFAAGHHATEQFGIQKLKEYCEKEFSVDCVFFNSDNPA